MKCDLCDQEFDTEAELDKHMAEMHASDEPEETPDSVKSDEQLEEPAYKRAVTE